MERIQHIETKQGPDPNPTQKSESVQTAFRCRYEHLAK